MALGQVDEWEVGSSGLWYFQEAQDILIDLLRARGEIVMDNDLELFGWLACLVS